jgi:hypothetical protein
MRRQNEDPLLYEVFAPPYRANTKPTIFLILKILQVKKARKFAHIALNTREFWGQTKRLTDPQKRLCWDPNGHWWEPVGINGRLILSEFLPLRQRNNTATTPQQQHINSRYHNLHTTYSISTHLIVNNLANLQFT